MASAKTLRFIIRAKWMNVEVFNPGEPLRTHVVDDWWNSCESELVRLFGEPKKGESK